MKKLLVLASLALIIVAAGLVEFPHPTFASGTLADAINGVINSTSWSADANTISVGTVFGTVSPSAFDSASSGIGGQAGAAWIRMIASEDGYTSQTLDSQVRSWMTSTPMTGALPVTYTSDGDWIVYDRYVVPLYSEFSGWSKSAALAELQSNLQANGGKPLLGFSSSGGWNYATRYYDEWIQDLDLLLKMGDTASAASLWAGVNANNWQGTYYSYRADQSGNMECEVGFFAAVVANYKMTVGSIPNFDRVSTDLYTKLLANGWNSPLWGAPSQMQHATGNNQLRLENTLSGIEGLQMYYCVSNSAYRSAFVNLLTGGTPAWQYLMNAGGWGSGGPDDGAEKAALLFLYGIIPDTGSLAVPTNEWHYEDWTSMMPSTLFKFNIAGHSIQIPVNAGNIKFDFGSSIASYNFPSNGVYNVQFSSDWNSVTSANQVSGLTQFHFLSGTSPPPVQGYGSIQVSGQVSGGVTLPVSFEAWYDSSSHIAVSESGTYTFTNVPSGTHTVYGLYNGIQKSASVTVSQGQTASCTLDFSSNNDNSIRPVWWPAPLPWPLPGFLATIVSTPLYMFATATVAIIALVGGAAELSKPKKGRAKIRHNFSLRERG